MKAVRTLLLNSEAQIIVDFKVIKNKNKCTLMLNQALYVMKVLLEKEMQNCSVIEIFMKSELYIVLNELDNVMKVNSINLQ